MHKPVVRAVHLLSTLALCLPAFAQVEVIEVQPAETTPVVIDSRTDSGGSSYQSTQSQPASRQASSGREPGQLFYQLQLLQQEVMTLRGQVEEQAHELRRLKKQSLDRYVDVDRRLAELNGNAAVAATIPSSMPSTTVSKPATTIATNPVVMKTPPPGEYAAYRAAYELVRSQRFDEAVEAFQAFLTGYAGGQYIPNAHYWLGELYLVVTPQKLEASRQSFTYLLEQYPDNSKVPDALYKLGKVHFLKGNPERSREFLDRLIAEHGSSGSTAVQLAQTFIEENF